MQSENDNKTQEDFSKYFINRLRELRNKTKVSAREMSIALGQNVNYINLIENGKRMPSMQGFFSICEYLGITPLDFFCVIKKVEQRVSRQSISEMICSLTQSQIECVLAMIQEFKKG